MFTCPAVTSDLALSHDFYSLHILIFGNDCFNFVMNFPSVLDVSPIGMGCGGSAVGPVWRRFAELLAEIFHGDLKLFDGRRQVAFERGDALFKIV